MPRQANEWTIEEAELNMLKLLEAARTNGPQRIVDPLNGFFIVSHTNPQPKPSFIKFLVEDGVDE
ncbi:hypothetical protein HFN62_23495 [Rhizobium leguminosarum]|uniref:hypothetical protein n=1 Tax=Rhizobium TaxID=379 RepID=UPI00103E8752|nr:hypothetical protein [Rhizobium leguminosarum]MBY5786678.1 hypothetical protein [Rhizobium leguminosarum]MBY5840397.1 hypothetical protein [Rhizobium leguminosarum]NKM80145.1 hypothetical protein [Rhizobium leguminosarum bv. viciae]QSZ06952.1 hypothetical protein J3P71_19025 [Rhizobium leguminosarum]TBZ59758.1 hypothetical protein E0H42_01195 [Rhizobium leguminosarum bv. viciae]